ncbi:OTU-domain-containing protein [Daldinia caldariorum]|uniref:OTU-domain-containing protein n=1 Tax=Daldinia caldariorum TaxID=326644 RepID=UPI0020076D29|nr:OTU-domain-containing protein [Daldinia caldariorum]KAI1469216.1 OTU-domain-containing protein [Daldinia caldariorum]
MKIRFKAPSGAGSVEVHDASTVKELVEAIKLATNYGDVTVKYGWPPKALTAEQAELSAQSLGLHRENLTVVPVENDSTTSSQNTQPTPEPTTTAGTAAITTTTTIPAAALPGLQTPSSGKEKSTTTTKGIKDQNISVPMPETGSTLVLRVMPDDNSCLFTAVGGALRGLRSDPSETFTPDALRRLVVEHIRAHPEKYSAVILGKSPGAYCAGMLRPDTWGGEIELAIVSEIFRLEIDVIDVKTGTVYRVGEGNGYPLRCVLVYSNVHYDRVAEIFVEGQEEVDFDVTRWAADESSDHIIVHAQEMCRKLKEEHHYYTDTSDFVVMCNECGWIGQGQTALAKHSLSTGHSDISEIKDTAA